MRTRSGESVPLRALLDEAIEPGRRQLWPRKIPTCRRQDRLAIGRIVGIGAVKYAELSQHRMTDYVFSWEKMLSLQGNTAPYLQNAYVRCRSIFRKLSAPFPAASSLALREKAELDLGKENSSVSGCCAGDPGWIQAEHPGHLPVRTGRGISRIL